MAKAKGNKPRLQSRPPRPQSAEDFIGGAEYRTGAKSTGSKTTGAKSGGGELPWLNPQVRDDVIKSYALRLPEPYLLKLKFIAEHTPYSMNRFMAEVLIPAIDRQVAELTK